MYKFNKTNKHGRPTVNLFETSCTDYYEGYCMNGGTCVYLIDEKTEACQCAPNYGGKPCEKWMWWHQRYVGKELDISERENAKCKKVV